MEMPVKLDFSGIFVYNIYYCGLCMAEMPFMECKIFIGGEKNCQPLTSL